MANVKGTADGSSSVMDPIAVELTSLNRVRSNGSSPPSAPVQATRSSRQTVVTIFQLCAISFWSSFTTGVVTVGLPSIAQDINLPTELYLWPSSVVGLTSGATLLIMGAIADVIGPYFIEVAGSALIGLSTLACGFATTGIMIVLFRAGQGIALSMHLPSSVALVSAISQQGKSRNLGFACLGLSQPLGFSFGLVLGGVMIENIGWRSCFYLSGSAGTAAALIGFWLLPKSRSRSLRKKSALKALSSDVDWIGGLLASGGFALVAYALALLSNDLHALQNARDASVLSMGLLLLALFPAWMRFREKRGKPALVPNNVWKRLPFASICIMVMLSYGVLNSFELFSILYFHEIQNVSPISTSLRLLPSLVVGTLVGLTVGLFVDKVSARWLVAISSGLCACAALMMALVNPYWSYWYLQFLAQVLSPLSGDVLFTVGLLVVADQFSEDTQALAGAVFNTMSQFGWSLGIGVCQVVALGIGAAGHDALPASIGSAAWTSLLQGYRAAFWTMFAAMVFCGLVAIGGLRKAGKVGVKRD